MRHAKRNFPAGGALYIREVDEYALRCFGAEVDFVLRVLRNALERFEHQIELTDVGKIAAAAFGAGYAVFPDKIRHLLKGHIVRVRAEILNEFVGPVARFAVLAVHQRV